MVELRSGSERESLKEVDEGKRMNKVKRDKRERGERLKCKFRRRAGVMCIQREEIGERRKLKNVNAPMEEGIGK